MTPRRPGAVLGLLAGVTLALTGCATPAPSPRLVSAQVAPVSETGAFQERLDSALQKMMDAVVGPGRAVVTTAAELDLDQVETVSTTWAKDPTAGALSEKLSRSAHTDGGTEWASTKAERVNALNSVRETRRNAPGRVRKLNIAVLVDATAATNLDLTRLRTLVSVAAGVDPGRGDAVVVSAMPFQDAAPAAAADTASAVDRRTLTLVAGLGLLLLILMMTVAGLLRGRRERLDRARGAQQARPPITVAATVETPRPDTAGDRRAIGRLAGEDPERAAAVLRGWAGS